MSLGPPSSLAIDHDDYHASHVGKTLDGRQFILTQPFVPATKDDVGREFLAIYLFDPVGWFVEARIDDLGPRHALDTRAAKELEERRLSELGPVEFCRIDVQPFEVERFGVAFGLIPRAPDERSDSPEDDDWWVEMQPGNYMAFHAPWDSGEYDT